MGAARSGNPARAREDERLRVPCLEQQVHERIDALVWVDQVDDMLDIGVCLAEARPLLLQG